MMRQHRSTKPQTNIEEPRDTKPKVGILLRPKEQALDKSYSATLAPMFQCSVKKSRYHRSLTMLTLPSLTRATTTVQGQGHPISISRAFTAAFCFNEKPCSEIWDWSIEMIIFSKLLSKTDTLRRCTVPMEYFRMEGFPRPRLSLEGNHWVDFDVKDESGHHWSLRCSIRNIGDDLDRPKHPKPVLIKEWIPFVQSKELCEGDRVIIYEEQDETGLMKLRIKVEKCTRPYETRQSPFMDQNPDGNEGSTSHKSSNDSEVIFHHPEDHSADVLNHELGRTTATTTFRIDKEQTTTTHSTSQDIAGYREKKPRLSLILELTPEQTTTGGMTAAISSGMDKKQTPTFHSHSQDIGCYNIETPSLDLNLELTLKPTSMQEEKPTTIDFLRFL